MFEVLLVECRLTFPSYSALFSVANISLNASAFNALRSISAFILNLEDDDDDDVDMLSPVYQPSISLPPAQLYDFSSMSSYSPDCSLLDSLLDHVPPLDLNTPQHQRTPWVTTDVGQPALLRSSPTTPIRSSALQPVACLDPVVLPAGFKELFIISWTSWTSAPGRPGPQLLDIQDLSSSTSWTSAPGHPGPQLLDILDLSS
ncbi:hypothetical protein NHX12_008377 [Muraenolepis orangiensis]|uniref:Uncharacterized protein n=1 Tax=Muraenolepis orangiensis TaxID=630683 RepID=A0A9Q0IB73_9TELE|nr:hypothetical protein NHX12_008377 [Muraenolepis orangiensis]